MMLQRTYLTNMSKLRNTLLYMILYVCICRCKIQMIMTLFYAMFILLSK